MGCKKSDFQGVHQKGRYLADFSSNHQPLSVMSYIDEHANTNEVEEIDLGDVKTEEKEIKPRMKREEKYQGYTRKEVVTFLVNWDSTLKLEDLLDEEKLTLKDLVTLYEKHCKEGEDEKDDDMISIDSEDVETTHEWPKNSGDMFKGKQLLDAWQKEIEEKLDAWPKEIDEKLPPPPPKKRKVKAENSDVDDKIPKEETPTKQSKSGRKPSSKLDAWQSFLFRNRSSLGAKAYKTYCESNSIDTKLPVWFNTPHGKIFKCLDQGNYDSRPFWTTLPHSEMDEGKYL